MKFNDAVFGAHRCCCSASRVLCTFSRFPRSRARSRARRLFPGIVAAALCVCAVLLIVGGVQATARRNRGSRAGPWTRSTRHVVAFVVDHRRRSSSTSSLADALGFLVIAPLLLVVLFVGVRRASATCDPATAIVATLAIHYAFYKLLRVPLPWGVLTADRLVTSMDALAAGVRAGLRAVQTCW